MYRHCDAGTPEVPDRVVDIMTKTLSTTVRAAALERWADRVEPDDLVVADTNALRSIAELAEHRDEVDAALIDVVPALCVKLTGRGPYSERCSASPSKQRSGSTPSSSPCNPSPQRDPEERAAALVWDDEAQPWDETHRPAQPRTEAQMPVDRWARLGSNPRPKDYESPALTTELRPRKRGTGPPRLRRVPSVAPGARLELTTF